MKEFGTYCGKSMVKLQELCKELRVKGETSGGHTDSLQILLEAPAGYVFSANLNHTMGESIYIGTAALLAEELLPRLRLGVDICEEPQCEYCHDMFLEYGKKEFDK